MLSVFSWGPGELTVPSLPRLPGRQLLGRRCGAPAQAPGWRGAALM